MYRGAANPAGVADFERWSGTDVAWALDYFPTATWSEIESPTWWTAAWSKSSYRTVYSVPLVPDTGGSVAEGASGAYDAHFVKLAAMLVAGGEADAVLRLGWEFNGDWYRWSANNDPAAFAAYWRRIVTAMRSVPGAAFKFDWCPVLGTGRTNPDLAYPGDAYVDYIGMDVYDQDWRPGWQDPVKSWQNLLTQPYGLQWHRAFAAAHSKPMTFPEWGLSVRPDGHGGGDNPYFIQKMKQWIDTNNVAYAMYFELDAPDGFHRLMTGQFPKAAAKFRELIFGTSTDDEPAPPAAGGVSPPVAGTSADSNPSSTSKPAPSRAAPKRRVLPGKAAKALKRRARARFRFHGTLSRRLQALAISAGK